ncbi:MAG TPA: hypothetical protein VJG64_02200 [Candidatus Paceibacterota bacterium]
MSEILAFFVGLLQATLSLLGFVQANPTLPPEQRDQAVQVAQQAITTATNAIASNRNSQAQGFSASPSSGPAPLTVTFSNIPTSAAEENIHFGDGKEASNGLNGWPSSGVVHTYTVPGTYTVTVISGMSNGEIGRLTVTVTSANTQSFISIPGMSKYTYRDLSFSFWYPSTAQSGYYSSKELSFMPFFDNYSLAAGLFIKGKVGEIFFVIQDAPSRSITVGAGDTLYQSEQEPNLKPVKYYFDTDTHTWMKAYPYGAPSGTSSATTTAYTGDNTMGGLHMFAGPEYGTWIVPISAQRFLVIHSGTSYSKGQNTELGKQAYALAKTILATDPSVATPVSAAEQIKIIQAEKDAYTVQ